MGLRAPAIALYVLLLLPLVSCEGRGGGAGDLRADCFIQAGPCSKAVDDMTVTLDIRPRPVRPMRELDIMITFSKVMDAGAYDNATVEFDMPGMYMGENRVELTHRGGGVYEGRGVLLRCPEGGSLWRARISHMTGNTAEFLFEVVDR